MAKTVRAEREVSVASLMRQLLEVACILAILDLAALGLNMNSWNIGGVTILWPSNGFLLGVCLCSPKRRWPALLAMGFFIDLAVNLALAFAGWSSVFFALCNMLEVGVAAALMYRTVKPKPDLTERRQLISLLIYGVVLAPAISAFLVYFHATQGSSPQLFVAVKHWFMADALGNAVMTPLYLSFASTAPGEHFSGRSRLEIAGLLTLLTVAAILVFWQIRFPFLFALMPVLLLLGFRLRLAGSALGLLIVSIVGGAFTIAGRGPAALITSSSPAGRDLFLQIFVAICMLMLYVVEVATGERDRLQVNLESSEARFRLLAEVSSDVIVLSDLDGRRQYISPAIKHVLGWEPEELLGRTYEEVVHPDDIAPLQELMTRLGRGEVVEPLTYRVRKKNGEYLWMEASLRLHRDAATDGPIGFVNVVRDISVRKAAEEQLTEAFRLVENLAMVDGLTGVANRRRFDETLEHEWKRAMRKDGSLSLLMVDVDHFKAYNDENGHIVGDRCLREVAAAAQRVLHRSADLFARYGGEEFAAVLPDTDRAGALLVAEQIRAAVEQCGFPHSGNQHGVVTVSVGCATLVPENSAQITALLHAADGALYRAKSAGRNCVRADTYAS